MMNDLILILSSLVAIISSLFVFIKGKKVTNTKSDLKYIPLLSIIVLMTSTIAITYYYEDKLKQQEIFLTSLKNMTINDSLLLTNNGINKSLENLDSRKKELEELLKQSKKEEKYVNNNISINDIKNNLHKTAKQIDKVQGYNKISNNEEIFSKKGYSTTGDTSNIIFNCPLELKDNYIDLELLFQENINIKDIAYIYLTIFEEKNEKENIAIFDQYYVPQNGINKFKIKNYFMERNKKKITMSVGYFLKSEKGKEYPTYEKVSCKY